MKKIYFLSGIVFILLTGYFLINVQPAKAAVGDISCDIKNELAADLSGATLYYYCTGGTEQSCVNGAGCDLDATVDIRVAPVGGASCDAGDTITARTEIDGYVATSTLGYGAYATSTQNNGTSTNQFAVKVTALVGSSALSGATVTVGNNFDTSCAESGSTGVYYCAELVAKTGATARLVKIGYTDKTGSYTDRTLQTSPQSTLTIYSGLYSPGADVPPAISQVEVKVSDTSATISWKTDKLATSKVNYGLDIKYGKEISSVILTTSHSLTLTGLSSSTTYHYQIKSTNETGNTTAYSDKTFTTLAPGQAPKEEGIQIPPIIKPISEMTITELNAEIARITSLIAQLQSQLTGLAGVKVFEGIPSGFKFETDLKYGMENDEVKYLQIILKKEVGPPTFPEHISATGWFGWITEVAVKKFQEKYAQDILAPWGLTEGSGIVRQNTRAKLNGLLGNK